MSRWPFLLSTLVLVLFILLAVGSNLAELGVFEEIKEISVSYDAEKDEYRIHVIHSDVVYEKIVWNNFLLGEYAPYTVPTGPAIHTYGHTDLVTGDTLYYTIYAQNVWDHLYGEATLVGPFGNAVSYNLFFQKVVQLAA